MVTSRSSIISFTVDDIYSISHQIHYNICTHPLYSDCVSIFVITSTDKYTYFQDKYPIMLHNIFTGIPCGYMHSFCINFSYHCFRLDHDCSNGIRPTQSHVDEAVLIGQIVSLVNFRSNAGSSKLWGAAVVTLRKLPNMAIRRCYILWYLLYKFCL